MNRDQLLQMWDHLRKVHGIGVRLIEAIPADQLDSHPIANMRTPKELVVHMYATVVREIAEGTVRGEIRNSESTEKDTVAQLRTPADLLAFVKESWQAADRAVQNVTDAQLQKMVPTPWNFTAPGFVMFGITHDEYLHHRGQLYAYTRALGLTPPMMWDFSHNAPEYQPKETPATA
jgi:uncharacterized damage-inducible protein DinB